MQTNNKMMLVRIALLYGYVISLACCILETPTCGYESCKDAQPGVLNIHVVAHTHDDVGWVETVDHYYSGYVRQILDSVIDGLYGFPHRRFIIVETAFFWKWWMEKDQETRLKVQQMVHTGQLMFAGGAWSMNDEAATHYQSIIDQFTWGLEKLVGTFGECSIPRVGWQIDPFGHSREFASLLAAMGYDGIFIGRIDYQDMLNRKANLSMETLWRGDDDLGYSSDIFTSVLYDLYVWPPSLCFDSKCIKSPLIHHDDQRVSKLIEYAIDVSKSYVTNNVLLTFGNDLAYTDAPKSFQNMDKLIEFTNWKAAQQGLSIKAFYSTPTCYLKAVKDAQPTLPTKQDDFFPYASAGDKYWTGYYTSRPTIKYFERIANSFLQVAKQLQVLAGLEDHTIFVINKLKTAMGVMQHHDAITGTEQQHVADDYVQMLDRAIDMALLVPRKAINKMLLGDKDARTLVFKRCHFNESRCEASEQSGPFIVAVYNPLAWNISEPIRIPITEGKYKVYAPSGKRITSQVVEIPPQVLSIPTRVSAATHEIVFITHLKPLMLKTYYIDKAIPRRAKRRLKNYSNVTKLEKQTKLMEAIPASIIENEHIMLSINYTTNEISHVSLADGTVTKLNIKFCYYLSSGGAYVFNPKDNKPYDVRMNYILGPIGKVVKEIKITSNNASSVIRIYKNLKYIENEWLIGPIDVRDRDGKEYIVRYVTDIVNNAQFYTDSNGRQMLKRILNKRPQWKLEVQDLVAGNYYPVTNKIFIEDDRKRVAVLTDRSEGGTSLEEGQIELMLHRRLRQDDGLGVNEALNEIVNGEGLVVRGKHRILLTKRNLKDKVEERKQVFQMHLQPLVLIANMMKIQTIDGPKPFDIWMSFKKSKTFGHKLPDAIHLLTLEHWDENKFLLRLENFLEKSDAKITDIQVNLNKMFKYIEIVSFTETNLAGQQSINEKNKWTWKTRNRFVENFNKAYGSNETEKQGSDEIYQKHDHSTNVVLSAKQIRTFVVSYKMN